ncbi:hypothetical protein [Bacillus subtilis]|uniref:hypothetical protein n=1 Tax=Bacillus subtilis TaxID=1423 RepID=UPI002DB76642|nr:hypothetical protein [Bacillus subtilis]MEC3664055.1 hypothetical protein [Bacillus subtilis]
MIYTLKSYAFFNFLIELDTIEEFYLSQEKYNEEMLTSWEKRFDEKSEDLNLTDKQKQEFFDLHSREPYRYEFLYPQLIRKTIFLQTYFILETYLNSLSDEHKGHSLSYKDMKGKGIERAKLYLRKVCHVPAEPFSTNEWKRIIDYNTLRNAFVHNNGVVDKSKLKAEPQGLILTKSSRKKDSTLCSIELQRDFLDEVFKTMRVFGNKLEGQ